jgi:thiamine-phosphate pyrophosphorylase
VITADVKPSCRLYLQLPAQFSAAIEAEIGKAAPADIGCILLRNELQPGEESGTRDLVASIQKLGIACLVEEDATLAARLGADGVHMLADTEAYARARALLGKDASIGLGCGANRHEAMRLAELGADYVAFGSGPGSSIPFQQCLELVSWWSEIFVVPCVAWNIDRPEDAAKLAAAGADFVALSAQAWQDKGPTAAAEFQTAIRQARRAA